MTDTKQMHADILKLLEALYGDIEIIRQVESGLTPRDLTVVKRNGVIKARMSGEQALSETAHYEEE